MSLQKIQSELNAPKDLYNSFGKYKYRSLEGILKAVKPMLNKLGYSLVISDQMVEVGGRVYVEATATLKDKDGLILEVNTACAREAETKKGMDESQITGAASSYARKYCLNGLFAIDDTKDADATNDHGKAPTPQQNAKVDKLRQDGASEEAEAERVVEMIKEIFGITSEKAINTWKKKNLTELEAMRESSFNEIKQQCADRLTEIKNG